MKYFYILDDLGGGAGNKLPDPPKNYAPISVQGRADWNGFLDYANKQGVDFDKNPQAGAQLMSQYKKTNPNFSISPDQIANIQYEQQQLRKGDTFGNLKPEQLKYLRQGLPDTYLNRPLSDPNGQFNANTSKLYYPQKTANGKSYGTDIEGYVNGVGGQPTVNTTIPGTPTTGNPPTPLPGNRPAGAIPLPDYNDSTSRLKYAQNWTKKYGPLMQGRGDTPLRLNEVPEYGTDTAKNTAIKSAKGVGLDPAILHASAMEEGLGGWFADKNGEYSYERSGKSDKFPVNSSVVLGLDQVRDRIKEFQQKGYLPADFQKHYTNSEVHDKNTTDNDIDLDSVESGMALKAAYLKSNYDEIDNFVKQKGITLSPKARDFFALANYNAGKGVGLQMLSDYNKNGYLKNDAFMNARPTNGEGLRASSYGPTYDDKGKQTGDGVYTNVLRRVKMAEALKKEGLFE